MNLEQSAEIEEARQVLGYAAQALDEYEKLLIAAFLAGHSDEQIAKVTEQSREAVFQQRAAALRKLKERLKALRISKCADLISSADVRPRQIMALLPVGESVDITSGKCPRGHERAQYSGRAKSGKLVCRLCRRADTKKWKKAKQKSAR